MKSAVSDRPAPRRRASSPIVWSIAAIAVAAGPAATGANLAEIYQMALERDPVLAAARAGHASRQQQVALARAALLPNVGANAGASESTITVDGTDINPDSPNFGRPFPEQQTESRNWSASVSQTVFNAQNWFSYRGAKARAMQADWELETSLQGLVARVADAYLNVLRAEAQLESVVAAEQAVQRQLEQVQQRFDVGLVAITDVLEAKAVYDNAVVSRVQAQGGHDNSFEGVRVLVAEPVLEIDRLRMDLPIVQPDPPDAEQWVERALANNYAVRGAKAALIAAERDARAQLAGHLPTVSASVSYGGSTGSRAFGSLVFPSQPSTSLSYSLRVDMPIFQGLRNYANVRQARHNLAQARQQLVQQELGVARDTRSQYRTVMTDVVRVAARGEAIKSNEAALEATQTGYEVGTRNIVEVLQAQQRLFQAQFDYATSRYDYVLNLLRLKESTGALGAEDLAEISRFADEADPIRPFSLRQADGER